tara:strand:- start:90 stop:1061 length:972 start_codon:yes stop_codon:yes gene_type:complete
MTIHQNNIKDKMMKLGYACVNTCLSNQPKSKRVTTNRSMIKRTFLERGIEYASKLSLENCRDLLYILRWNETNGIKFYRMSSDLFPWSSEYRLKDLPDYEEICYYLNEAGMFVDDHGHRITTHPGPFNVLGSPNENTVRKTIKELETHSEIFDLIGLPPTPYAKINIHVGGTYGGDFSGTAERWCNNFLKLSANCQNRITLENDDKASMWSVKHLYDYIYKVVRIPIVFDYHHYKFCTGGQSEQDALQMAASTWGDIKPVVHLSESRREEKSDQKIKPQAHSDYIYNPVKNYGVEYDMMLECKMKEQALLNYRKILKKQEIVA